MSMVSWRFKEDKPIKSLEKKKEKWKKKNNLNTQKEKEKEKEEFKHTNMYNVQLYTLDQQIILAT